jgi:prepilin-type N-terminal cleavage/methylation domain-containing protein
VLGQGGLLMRRPSLRDESGFTLPELLMTLVIGVMILGSGTLITIGAARHNVEVANRTDATQRGRLALEKAEQLLRAQTCSSASNYPIVAATPASVTFYSDLKGGAQPAYKHTLTFDPAAKTLTDTSIQGSNTIPQTFTGAARTETLATDVTQNAANPVFRYWSYPTPAPASGALTPNVELLPGAAGLTNAQIGKVARIDINFLTTGTTTKTSSTIKAEMYDQVFVRLANPNSTTTFDPSCS